MADSMVIETLGLEKQYKGLPALGGLDLAVPAGSIYGLLGRNGAGKTTAMKILMGMVHSSGGSARVFGLAAEQPASSAAIRRRTGFVDDERDLYDFMSVAQLIAFTAGFFPKWRTEMASRYVRDFDLPESRRVRALSRGARTKLALLLAFCRSPELLILDEATSGLDPVAAEEVLQILVRHAASEGATVFFSSHQIVEIEQIADHVAIIDRGRTILHGELDDIKEAHRRIEIVFEGDAPDLHFRSPGVVRVARKGRSLSVLAVSGVGQIIEEARGQGSIAADVRPVTLKEIFLDIAGKGC
jgi:ABC-2 type transport system ATP-binding protein